MGRGRREGESESERERGHVVPMQRSPVLLRAAPPEASGCARTSLRLSPGGLHVVSLLGEARAPAASVTPPGPQPARGRRRAPRGGRGPETRSSSVPSRQSRPGPVPGPPSPRSAATQATAAPRSPWPCGVGAPCPIAQSAFPRRARFRARDGLGRRGETARARGDRPPFLRGLSSRRSKEVRGACRAASARRAAAAVSPSGRLRPRAGAPRFPAPPSAPARRPWAGPAPRPRASVT